MRKLYLMFLLLIYTTVVYGQISPGDLTVAHADLEGMSNCTKCHEIGEAVTNAKCLDCHKEINNLRLNSKGYHASEDVENENCVKCHSEHHGRKFEMIRFDKNNFDHKLTGYRLTAKHSDIDCEKCHNEKLIDNSELKKRKKTYLGLSSNCSDCHEDQHHGTLSKNWNNCHNTDGFKPAKNFNHDSSAFKLTGAHVNTDCIECHIIEKRNGKDFQVFKGIKFGSCLDCHSDIHKGKLGNNCESCHSTKSFHRLIGSNIFDHSKTNFVLIGKHKNAKCADCHTVNFKSIINHELCNDCHKDYHKGELVKPNEVYDCSICHNEHGFAQAKFTIDDHNKTGFPLMGSHLAVPCLSCHKKEESWKFKLEFSSCSGCHSNVHKGTMSSKFLNDSNCSSCHVTESWDTIIFNHNTTNFTLIGKHKTVDCYVCHNINKSEAVSDFVFINLSTECESCHPDTHYNQFIKNGKTNCSGCHTSINWNPEKFSHDNTGFLLEGAHSKVSCDKCHTKKTVATGVFVKYKFKSLECVECHGNSPMKESNPKGDI